MATMTMSKEWIYQHGIYRLLKRSESVRSTATALMAIVECTYGSKNKEYIEIPYDDKRGNYECIVYQCEECGIDNIYMKIKEE